MKVIAVNLTDLRHSKVIEFLIEAKKKGHVVIAVKGFHNLSNSQYLRSKQYCLRYVREINKTLNVVDVSFIEKGWVPDVYEMAHEEYRIDLIICAHQQFNGAIHDRKDLRKIKILNPMKSPFAWKRRRDEWLKNS